MSHVVKYFLRGLLVVVPAAATGAILWMLFQKIDRWMGLEIPGVGFLATILVVTLIGFMASNFVTKQVFVLLERVLARVPLVKLLYGSIRDLTSALVGEKKSFDRPVLVSFVGGASALGFATRDSLAALGLEGHVAVYFPQAYALAGLVLVFPREQVTALAVSASEVMAFIVSGGVSGLVVASSSRDGASLPRPTA